jgi:predicted  nucleic acid-binding Zn-ribbon protein
LEDEISRLRLQCSKFEKEQKSLNKKLTETEELLNKKLKETKESLNKKLKEAEDSLKEATVELDNERQKLREQVALTENAKNSWNITKVCPQWFSIQCIILCTITPLIHHLQM